LPRRCRGKIAKDRQQLHDALEFVREGDTLIVTRLDRLARSVSDLYQIVEKLAAKGVAFRCINQSGVDTDSSTGKLMLAILGAVAQFENDIRRERQMEGIEKAKAEGKYRGRKPSIDPTQIRELHGQGLGASAIARWASVELESIERWRHNRIICVLGSLFPHVLPPRQKTGERSWPRWKRSPKS
jgi:DNA invertase Pin-like site-specific DNA recombinase